MVHLVQPTAIAVLLFSGLIVCPEVIGFSSSCVEEYKFDYPEGVQYIYDYSAKATTGHSNDEDVSFDISAKVAISKIGRCRFLLEILDVALEDSAESHIFSYEIQKFPTEFDFNNGVIARLYSNVEEEIWITNFKRGILSMIQNTMNDIDESETVKDVDVIGECTTSYIVSTNSKNDKVVYRTKSYDTCDRVAKSMKGFSLTSPLKSVDFVSSEEECSQRISGDIIQEVNCRQILEVKPTSNFYEAQSSFITTLLLSKTSIKMAYTPDIGSNVKFSSLEFQGLSSSQFLSDKSSDQLVEDLEKLIAEATYSSNLDIEIFNMIPDIMHKVQSDHILMGISSMVSNYCSTDPNCMEKEPIRLVIELIESYLGPICHFPPTRNSDKALLALLALENAAQINDVHLIEKCFTDESNSMNIRVSALKTLRKTPCNLGSNQLLRIFQDQNQNSELRIASYLSLMECPSSYLLEKLHHQLSFESVTQVGSFVWSHLKNLVKTQRSNQLIVRLVNDYVLSSKYEDRNLKLSRNYYTHLNTEQGYDTALETNVIFSEDSSIPRSMMLNLTSKVFGKPMNILEFGGRFESLESDVMKFLSSYGTYQHNTFVSVPLIEHDSGADNSYYVKAFGKLLHANSFGNWKSPSMDVSFFKQIIIDLAREVTSNRTTSYNLMDSEITYPTIIGFPVNLNLSGYGTVNLNMNGQFKLNSLSDIDIDGFIHPSLSCHMNASMLVDLHVTKYGLKLISNLNVSLPINGKIKVDNGRLVDISLKAIEDKLDLIKFESSVITVVDDSDVVPMSSSKSDSNDLQCLEKFNHLGFKLCINHFTNKNYLKKNVLLIKTIKQDSYNLKYQRESNSISLSMDTTKSELKKLVSLVITNSEDFENNAQRRSKRSLRNNIGLIGYYFESIQFNMSTSLDETQDISLTFQKTEKGFEFDCRGFNEYVKVSTEFENKMISVSVNADSSIGLGKSDPYVSLRGSGALSYYTTYGKGNFQITTPYADYESIDLEFLYDYANSLYKLNVTSNNNLKIFLSTDSDKKVDIFIPNSQEPTIALVEFGSKYDININVSSRFYFIRSFSLYGLLKRSRASLTLNYRGLGQLDFEFAHRMGKATLNLNIKVFKENIVLEIVDDLAGNSYLLLKSSDGKLKINFEKVEKVYIARAVLSGLTFEPINADFSLDVTVPLYSFHLNVEIPETVNYDLYGDRDIENPLLGNLNCTVQFPHTEQVEMYRLLWDFVDLDYVAVKLTIPFTSYLLTGKMHLLNTEIYVSSPKLDGFIIAKWLFSNSFEPRVIKYDNQIKLGYEKTPYQIKVTGIMDNYSYVTNDITFKVPAYMVDFNIDSELEISELTASGNASFVINEKNGVITLNYDQINNASTTTSLNITGNTNIYDLESFSIVGEYLYENRKHASAIALNVNQEQYYSLMIDYNNPAPLKFIYIIKLNRIFYFSNDIDFGMGNKRTLNSVLNFVLDGIFNESMVADVECNYRFTSCKLSMEGENPSLGKRYEIESNYKFQFIYNPSFQFKFKNLAGQQIEIKWFLLYQRTRFETELMFEASKFYPVIKVTLDGELLHDEFELNSIFQIRNDLSSIHVRHDSDTSIVNIASPLLAKLLRYYIRTILHPYYDANKINSKDTSSLRIEGSRTSNDLSFFINFDDAELIGVLFQLTDVENGKIVFKFISLFDLKYEMVDGIGTAHCQLNDKKLSGQVRVYFDKSVNWVFEDTCYTSTLNGQDGRKSYCEVQNPVEIQVEVSKNILSYGRLGEYYVNAHFKIFETESNFKFSYYVEPEISTFELSSKSGLQIVPNFEILKHFDDRCGMENAFYRFAQDDFSVTNKWNLTNSLYYFSNEMNLLVIPKLNFTISANEKFENFISLDVGSYKGLNLSFHSDDYSSSVSGELSSMYLGLNSVPYQLNYYLDENTRLNVFAELTVAPDVVIHSNLTYLADYPRNRVRHMYENEILNYYPLRDFLGYKLVSAIFYESPFRSCPGMK